MIDVVNTILSDFFSNFFGFFPNFLAGLIILLIGLIISNIVKHILVAAFSFLRLDNLFSKTKLIEKNGLKVWEEVLVEIIKWSLIVVFLVPTLEVWGLTQAVTVLNQLLVYLPNVIVAIIVSFVGLVTSNLASDVVRHSVKSLGTKTTATLAMFARGIIIFFTILIVLNQLGVAQDLVKILFTGIVAMLALAGGLAFGLGGQEVAKELLQGIKKQLEG